MGVICYEIEEAKIPGPKECEPQKMEDIIEEGLIPGAEEMKLLDETNHKEEGKCICKIIGSKLGTGFFCKIKYGNKLLPVLITNYHVIDDKFIESNEDINVCRD